MLEFCRVLQLLQNIESVPSLPPAVERGREGGRDKERARASVVSVFVLLY